MIWYAMLDQAAARRSREEAHNRKLAAERKRDLEWSKEFPDHPQKRQRGWAQPATIEEGHQVNERGYEQACVWAICNATGDASESSYGTGHRSINRCLLLLSKSCSCGARWHEEDER